MITKSLLLLIAMTLTLSLFTSCASQKASEKERSIFNKASVEQTLHAGKTGKQEVINQFGMPEMINSDQEKNEYWVYSKHFNESESSGVSADVATWALGQVSPLDFVGVGASKSSHQSTQKTITVTLVFTPNGLLKDYQYSKVNF